MDRHPATLSDKEFCREVEVESTRGSGPGGQHRNKVDTAIRLKHVPSGLRAQAGERRSKHQNHQAALKRLRLKVALLYRTPLDAIDSLTVGPSAAWRARLKDNRVHVGPTHPEFPGLLAEALDMIHFTRDDLARAARLLETSTAQLVRFLSLEPSALAAINERRQERGQKPFRRG